MGIGGDMKIGQLDLGKIDGKFEFREGRASGIDPFDSFLIPENVQPASLKNDEKYFVYGFRGTGKTSLLRWLSHQKSADGALVDFVLFKTEIPETERKEISSEVGFKMQEIDSGKLEFSQDFKTAWTWFLIHRIAEALHKVDAFTSQIPVQKLTRLCGLDKPAYKKVLGFLPRMKGLSFKIGADVEFFQGELGAEFEPREGGGEVSLGAMIERAKSYLKEIDFGVPLYVFLDELEVFYEEETKYTRDQRMVRDLMFVTSQLNDFMCGNKKECHIIAAVRSEVLDGMGAIGQEVDRLVYDQGIPIVWHFARRSTEHPLFEMLAKKIRNSDAECTSLSTSEIISNYFPQMVRNESIDQYLLDRSFYRPRDLIWRLTIIQKQYPEDEFFRDETLRETENDYSKKMWDEIAYELSASYSKPEVEAIEMLISGSSDRFQLHHIEGRSNVLSLQSEKMRSLLSRVGLIDILQDLYRLGAIGNFFREGASASDIRNRWSFRGDPTLLPNKQMTINYCLHKRLSTVKERRRGSRGGGR